MQPNFRDNFDAWRTTPLDMMDGRNLSEDEKKKKEENKRVAKENQKK